MYDGNLETKTLKSEPENVQLDGLNKNSLNSDPTKETAILFAQVTSAPGGLKPVINSAKALLGVGTASFFMAPVATVSLGSKVALNPVMWAGLLVAGVFQQGSAFYNRAVSASYCGDIPTANGEKEGCSVVRTVDYEVEDILKYCKVIESI